MFENGLRHHPRIQHGIVRVHQDPVTTGVFAPLRDPDDGIPVRAIILKRGARRTRRKDPRTGAQRIRTLHVSGELVRCRRKRLDHLNSSTDGVFVPARQLPVAPVERNRNPGRRAGTVGTKVLFDGTLLPQCRVDANGHDAGGLLELSDPRLCTANRGRRRRLSCQAAAASRPSHSP